MAKVTGIGGVFFKSADRDGTHGWLKEHFGIPVEPYGWVALWKERETDAKGCTVLSAFPADTDYFAPSEHPFMINLRVDDLDGMLAQLRTAGITVVKEFEPQPNGRFAHVMGPDGMKFELWEPVSPDPYDP